MKKNSDALKVSIIKFASRNQVKAVHTFAQDQTKDRILREIRDLPMQTEYSPTRSSDLMKVEIIKLHNTFEAFLRAIFSEYKNSL